MHSKNMDKTLKQKLKSKDTYGKVKLSLCLTN
jgi:hypothetical protein